MIRAALLAALALAACSKKSEDGERGPVPISASERERGEKACSAYVERLCACAEKQAKPELAKTCQGASSRVETLSGLLGTSDENRVNQDVYAVQIQARKIIKNCVEDMLELDQQGCP